MDIVSHHSRKNTRIKKSKKRDKIKHYPAHISSSEAIMDWKTEEFAYHEKTRNWFIAGGILFFLIVGYFAYSKQLITALTFLLLGFTIYIFSIKKPRTINCFITHQGITVDEVFYPFKEIESFWIFFEPPDFKFISLKHKKQYLPYSQIPIGDEDPMKIRKILMEYLPEEEQQEPFSDKLARLLKF